jgi:uncharacterized protein YjbI with pentapeptide repeats
VKTAGTTRPRFAVEGLIEIAWPARNAFGELLSRLTAQRLDRARQISYGCLTALKLEKQWMWVADLSCANLRGADLRRADLSGAKLSRANLKYAAENGAILDDDQRAKLKDLATENE